GVSCSPRDVFSRVPVRLPTATSTTIDSSKQVDHDHDHDDCDAHDDDRDQANSTDHHDEGDDSMIRPCLFDTRRDRLGSNHRVIQKKLLYNFIDRTGEPCRILSQLLKIQKLKVKFIQWSREALLSIQINPVEQGLLWLCDAVGVVAS